jgi:hypothetical protein
VDSYWEAVATTIPVIALALVVELRTLRGEWRRHAFPSWVRLIQVMPIVVYLVAAVYVEYTALSQLRSNPPTKASTGLAEYTIGGGLILLVIGPAVTGLLAIPGALYVAHYMLFPHRAVRKWQLRRMIDNGMDTVLRARLFCAKQGLDLEVIGSLIVLHKYSESDPQARQHLVEEFNRVKRFFEEGVAEIASAEKLLADRRKHLDAMRTEFRRASIDLDMDRTSKSHRRGRGRNRAHGAYTARSRWCGD